ncbi:MAG TPA: HAMP domain-containing sensor histidine kinase [Dehalococcoidia bacterium]|jgi:signal transduction histidine kinase|nr:HAMP domain-containing sensor histidine kinase [Dehalococcoidia bacterium]
MLGSLRARLIISFAAVVGLAVFLSGAGALFLLRDEQEATARERYGRHAEPINERITTMLALGGSLADVREYADGRAAELGVRLLIIDDDLNVVHDTDGTLQGQVVLTFENRGIPLTDENGARYKAADYRGNNTHLTLFAPPPEVTTVQGDFAPREYVAYVAIPAEELASAWLELAPRLILAGAIALVVSFGVAFVISRSISGPLRRITQASQQMARGDYDVHIPIRGEDEVGRLSEAFNQMAREVSQSQRMMKDLLANVSHELKTPLTSIQGFSQAMLDGAAQDEESARDSARIINEEANRMRALVEDLLLLSQIETGQVLMQHTHVDLGALLEHMMERFQFAVRDGDIRTGVSIGHLPMVHGDARRLEQVFSNLMENAVRHTPPGGSIDLSARVEQDGSVAVSVHNSGSHIPAEDLPRVFERFFQVDRARARKGGSSGLGLSIVSEIVEAHGGTVRAVSSAETGTEFIVTLPPATRDLPRNGRASQNGQKPARRAARKRQAPA